MSDFISGECPAWERQIETYPWAGLNMQHNSFGVMEWLDFNTAAYGPKPPEPILECENLSLILPPEPLIVTRERPRLVVSGLLDVQLLQGVDVDDYYIERAEEILVHGARPARPEGGPNVGNLKKIFIELKIEWTPPSSFPQYSVRRATS